MARNGLDNRRMGDIRNQAVLNDVFGGLQSGVSIPLNKGSKELAGIIFSSMFDPFSESPSPPNAKSCPGESGLLHQPTPSLQHQTVKETETICLALTLTEKIIAKLLLRSFSQDISLYFKEVLRILFEDMDLMLRLVSILGSQDKLLSHLTAKCVSSFVIYELQNSNECCSVWRETCLETFQRPCSRSALDACMWSLTAVIKGVLRGDQECKSEAVERLLTVFDPVLADLYSKLLPHERTGYNETAANPDDAGHLGTTLSTFIDLIEVLTAARLKLGTCARSQRLLFLRASPLLRVADSQEEYFVKKRVLLLLKRSLLQRPGEDLALGALPSPACGDAHLAGDMCALADTVLQEVHSGWLLRVSVRPQASFFGGAREARLGGGGASEARLKPGESDHVMLRAVSLVLLKSLEYKIQSVSTKGGDRTVDVQRHLSELLLFLSQHGTLFKPGCHPCTWVSRVFGEQDDDMIEAAKALIILYLHQTSLSSASEADVCDWGGNPHCHFVLLLSSVAFDHTVLLDFLISSETCFLEYFVRYLKHLRDDWESFCGVCRHVEVSNSDRQQDVPVRETQTLTRLSHSTSASGRAPGSETTDNQNDVGSPSVPPENGAVPPSVLRLVDYGSSEDSGEEERNVSDGLSTRTAQHTGSEPSHTEAGGPGLSPPICTESWVHSGGLIPRVESLAGKVVLCLMELSEVISRLHSRNLFPYNPASLLRLLRQINTKS